MSSISFVSSKAPGRASERARLWSVLGGSIGNLIEWYDWYVYAAFALYFSEVFFPKGDQTAHLLNTAAVFALGFFARPAGSWLMGLYADHSGRRPALILAALAMGSASFLIAITPGYVHIGIAAPGILLFCRIVQGLS